MKTTNIRAKLLQRRREELGWTVREAARRAKLANGTITAAEDPESDPKESTLTKLAKCYGLDPCSLLNPNLRPKDFRLAVLNSAG